MLDDDFVGPIAESIASPEAPQLLRVDTMTLNTLNAFENGEPSSLQRMSTITLEGPIGDQNRSNIQRTLVTLLYTLCQYVQPDRCNSITRRNFEREVSMHDHRTLIEYIARHIGYDGKCAAILRACNQSIIAPAITQMKMALMGRLDYRDVSGGWKVIVTVPGPESNCSACSVTHLRQEQVYICTSNRPGDDCNVLLFEWSITLLFTEECNDIQEISIELNNIERIKDHKKAIRISSSRQHSNKTSGEQLDVTAAIEEAADDGDFPVAADIIREEQRRLEEILRQVIKNASVKELHKTKVEYHSSSPVPPGLSTGTPIPTTDEQQQQQQQQNQESKLKRLTNAFKRMSTKIGLTKKATQASLTPISNN